MYNDLFGALLRNYISHYMHYSKQPFKQGLFRFIKIMIISVSSYFHYLHEQKKEQFNILRAKLFSIVPKFYELLSINFTKM